MWSQTFVILSVVLLFMLVSARKIELPGLQYDEALQLPAAIVFINGQPNGVYNKFGTQEFAGRILSLMTLEYIGAVKSYYLIGPIKLWGASVKVFRYACLIIAVLAILVTWIYLGNESGQIAAAMGIILVATDPVIIMLTRTDWGPVSIAFLMRMLSLMFLTRWWRSQGKSLYLMLSAVCVGLGIYDKANFLWFVTALLTVGAVAMLISKHRPKLTFISGAGAIIVVMIVSFPLWLYNIYYNWPTFKILARGQSKTSIWEWPALVYERVAILLNLMNAGGPDSFYFGESLPGTIGAIRTLLLPLSIITIMYLIYRAVKDREWKLLFIPSLILLIAVQISITPLPIGMHHWTMIYPFPHLVIATVFGRIWRQESKKKNNKIIIAILSSVIMIGAVGLNMKTMLGYMELIDKTGGVKYWSAEIYTLADRLKQEYPDRPIQLMDWGMGNNLFFLSEGNLHTREPYWNWAYNNFSEPDDHLLDMILDPRNVYVLNAPEGTLFSNVRKAFYQAIEQTGQRVVKEERLYDRRSIWIYSIVEVGK